MGSGNIIRLFMLYCNDNVQINQSDEILESGLTKRQFKTLLRLYVLKCSTTSNLAQSIGLAQSTVSNILSKLVDMGYVDKLCPKGYCDERKRLYSVTKKGKVIINGMLYARTAMFENICSELSDDDKEVLSSAEDILERLFMTEKDKLLFENLEKLISTNYR